MNSSIEMNLVVGVIATIGVVIALQDLDSLVLDEIEVET